MHKLLKEAMKIYGHYLKQGPQYLDSFDNGALVEATFEAIKTKQLQDYIRRELKPIADVSMLPIYMAPEHKFTIALFALKGGVSMPLHDHPNMFVLSHVVDGVGEREAWDVDQSEKESVLEFRRDHMPRIVKAKEHPRKQLKMGDNCFTTPNNQNLHRFRNKSNSEMFLFLDVILPHYNGLDRIISFYEPVSRNQLQISPNPNYVRHPIGNVNVDEFLVQ